MQVPVVKQYLRLTQLILMCDVQTNQIFKSTQRYQLFYVNRIRQVFWMLAKWESAVIICPARIAIPYCCLPR